MNKARAVAPSICVVVIALLLEACAPSVGRPSAPSPAGPVSTMTPSGAVDAVVTAIALGVQPAPRLSALQKGSIGRVSRDDVVRISPPNATMGLLPMLAGELDQDWIVAVVAANNLGPSAASVGDYAQLQDSQGRTFAPSSPADFPDYQRVLQAVREQRKEMFRDRELISYTTAIQPSQDAYVLLIFQVAPDSDDLALASG